MTNHYAKAKAYCQKHPKAFSKVPKEEHSIFKHLSDEEYNNLKKEQASFIESQIFSSPDIKELIISKNTSPTIRFRKQVNDALRRLNHQFSGTKKSTWNVAEWDDKCNVIDTLKADLHADYLFGNDYDSFETINRILGMSSAQYTEQLEDKLSSDAMNWVDANLYGIKSHITNDKDFSEYYDINKSMEANADLMISAIEDSFNNNEPISLFDKDELKSHILDEYQALFKEDFMKPYKK